MDLLFKVSTSISRGQNKQLPMPRVAPGVEAEVDVTSGTDSVHFGLPEFLEVYVVAFSAVKSVDDCFVDGKVVEVAETAKWQSCYSYLLW